MKAQSDIISSVIIIIIAISLVSTAYMWGMPLIQKRQDTALSDRVGKFFDPNNYNSIIKKIEYIAKNGGEDTFNLDVDGLWTLFSCPSADGISECSCDVLTTGCNTENNSVQFSFFSRVTNIAYDQGWVSLSATNTGGIGTVGIDNTFVVWAKAVKSGEGFQITYKIWFRELDESPTKGYKIDLVSPSGKSISSGKAIRISNEGTKYISVGKELIITKIKLSFI
ncbi:MAG TPA: hypothetical protein VJ343_02210 [archaeon]|nr:hypothetical protein [archaeon]